MTTPLATQIYESQHVASYNGRPLAVFNPNNAPVETLPVIYGFNNGGSRDMWYAQLISEDGAGLGSHLCSSEAYMPADLGCLDGTRPDRHATFARHYPDGYRMEFVRLSDVKTHAGLNTAVNLNKERQVKIAQETD